MSRIIFLKNKTTPTDPYETTFTDGGFEPVFVPLIRHFHVPDEALTLFRNRSYLTKLKYIIVTSQRTVECLNESILPKMTTEEQSLLKEKTIYTVGPATSEFLRNSGFQNIRGGVEVGNGGLLADLIVKSHSEEEIDHFLFLVGEIRRDIIPKKLKANGYKVNEIVTYKTENLLDNIDRFILYYKNDENNEAVMNKPSTWIVFFSPQGTEDIIEYLKENKGYKIASIGPTTEQYLLEKGLKPDTVSFKPSPIFLLNAINSYK